MFIVPYKSIIEFKEVEFKDFTILTGINGSGKTHLLEAIEKGKVQIKKYTHNGNVIFFNYENFKLESNDKFTIQDIYIEKNEAWKFFNQNIKFQVRKYKDDSLKDKYKYLKNKAIKEKKSIFNVIVEVFNEELDERIKKNENTDKLETLDFFENYIYPIDKLFDDKKIKEQPYSKSIYSLIESLPYSIDEITEKEFKELYKPYLPKGDFLPKSLDKIIWDYYVRYINNKFKLFLNVEEGKNFPILSEKEFIKKYGEKPWELLNKILQEFGNLDYKVVSP